MQGSARVADTAASRLIHLSLGCVRPRVNFGVEVRGRVRQKLVVRRQRGRERVSHVGEQLRQHASALHGPKLRHLTKERKKSCKEEEEEKEVRSKKHAASSSRKHSSFSLYAVIFFISLYLPYTSSRHSILILFFPFLSFIEQIQSLTMCPAPWTVAKCKLFSYETTWPPNCAPASRTSRSGPNRLGFSISSERSALVLLMNQGRYAPPLSSGNPTCTRGKKAMR